MISVQPGKWQIIMLEADAGLIITEGTIISPDGQGYSNAPGIFTQTHIDGWKMVTEAVHERGGKIFLQIWHVGRVSHPIFYMVTYQFLLQKR